MADEGVVLPIPISPVPTMATPSALAWPASSIPTSHGGNRLFPRHGRSLGEVARTAGDLLPDQPGELTEIVIHPDVHHPHFGPGSGGPAR